MSVRCRAWFVMASAVLSAALAAQAEPPAAAVKVFDGQSKIIVVNGYSTSFQWPGILERKLSRFFGGKGPVRVHRDVEYARAGQVRLLMDVYVPKWAGGPLPLVVWIHGGAWRGGDKAHCPALGMVGRGYVVASVNYRLSGRAKFPAQIHDCKAAIRFLRADAVRYKIDSKRVGVCGSSAGGHLAALLGTSGGVKRLEGDLGSLDQSSRVQAACTWAGPSDLTRLITPGGRGPVGELLGGPPAARKDLAGQANPITHVSKDDPPFLLMHGDRDRTVPLAQARLLHDALTQAGVDAALEVVQGAGHGFRSPQTVGAVARFFDKRLKAK